MDTRQDFINELKKVLHNYWKAFKSAPVRRGYNRLSGQQVLSKSDLSRACTANLKELNNICVTSGFDAIWIDPEEEVVELKGKPVK